MQDLIDRTLGHYRIVEKIGAGGMGEVYLARDSDLERKVALKVLSSDVAGDAEQLNRLRREARSLAALDHPNIVPVYSFEREQDIRFLTMAYIDGQPLDRLIPPEGMDLGDLLDLAVPLADALRAAHEQGIVHRDLKPANVMVDREGRPRVLDFGLAKQHAAFSGDHSELTTMDATEQMTRAGMILGTYPYMSPEQAEGRPVDARSDLFSFGVMLYEMACGRRPFQGETGISIISSILRVRQQPIDEVRPDLPARLETIVGTCLEKDPDQRYPTAAALRSDLEEFRTEVTRGPGSASVRTRSDEPIRVLPALRLRRGVLRLAVVAVVAVVAAVAGFGAWKLWSPVSERQTLAVLPFDNVQGEPESDYLCEGVVETLIRQLSALPAVGMAPLSAAISAKAKGLDAVDAGRVLGVGLVLDGTLDRQGDRVLVEAALHDVETGSHLWSNSYERPAGDLLGMQEEIATAILNDGLRANLTDKDQLELVRGPTTDGEAYDLFLQARHRQRRATEDDYLQAMELLRRATVRDPRFTQAFIALAGIHAAMAIDGYQRPTDAWAQSNRALRQAVALDPDHPDGYALRNAMAFFFDWDWEGAARERRLAMRLPVGEFDPDLLRTFSLELLALGRPEEALAMARRSRELDQLSIGLAMLEADYLVRVGNLDAAIALYRRTIEVEPDNPEQYFGLAEALIRQGKFDQAIEARRTAHAIAGDDEIAGLFDTARGGEGYREADRAWVAAQLVWLEARSAWGYVSPLDFARAHAQLGNTEEAFQYLEQAFEDRSPGLVFLNVDTAWDEVRSDPRFEEAVGRVGLPGRTVGPA